MKTYKVTFTKERSCNVTSNSKQDAIHIARKKLGSIIKGQFLPLHWSEVLFIDTMN